MKKGSFGYLNWKKKISILIAAVLVAMVMVVYFGALRYFGTNRNVFSLLAAHLAAAYDLYLTSYDNNYQLSHLAAANRSICALTESDSCNIKEGETHIRKMLQDNGFRDYTVKIFRDRSKYLDRLDEMNRTAGGKKHKRDEEVLQLFYQISI